MSAAFVVIGTNMLIRKQAAQPEKLFRSYAVPMVFVPSLSMEKAEDKMAGYQPNQSID